MGLVWAKAANDINISIRAEPQERERLTAAPVMTKLPGPHSRGPDFPGRRRRCRLFAYCHSRSPLSPEGERPVSKPQPGDSAVWDQPRSEERRVGKECRYRGAAE